MGSIPPLFQQNGEFLQIIRGAGHHVYADAPEAFNEIVCGILEDEGNETDSTTKEVFSETDDEGSRFRTTRSAAPDAEDSDSTLHKVAID